jgi:hypothetical protein
VTSPSAKVLLDSISPDGARLTTMEVTLHRWVLAEMNTHRAFCLAGDSILEFDLPTVVRGKHRVYKMSIAEFVDKWHNGAAPRRNKGGRGHNRQPMQDRLRNMQIRQLDEHTGLVSHSTVVDCAVSGKKQVYEIKAGRHVIAGSLDHLILTPNGYVRIGDLDEGDEIVVQKKSKRPEEVLDPTRLKKIGGRWRSVWQRQIREQRMEEIGCCEGCNGEGPLDIHHIVSVHVDPSLAFDEDNVEMLCKDCHKVKHAQQGWQGGTYLLGVAQKIDSITYRGVEETYDLWIEGEFANFIANGAVVHNSRNSASSRAIPVEKMLARVLESPAEPVAWPAEQKGMSGGAELEGRYLWDAQAMWRDIRRYTDVRIAAYLESHPDKSTRLHKSLINRRLEPDLWHTVIVSSTEWQNFFALRCHPSAQPEIRVAAEQMKEAYYDSAPSLVDWDAWHMPLLTPEDDVENKEIDWRKVSAARCARVSYLQHSGVRDVAEDLALYERLATAVPSHRSPMEHVAKPAVGTSLGNFEGWHQLRHATD